MFAFVLGVYFADMSSKSANYCWPSRTNDIGLLLLCEVAIGSPNELKGADYSAASLPSGKNSVKGLGRCVPDPSKETRDHLYKDRSSRKTDSPLANRSSGSLILLKIVSENQFSGKTYFIQLPPGCLTGLSCRWAPEPTARRLAACRCSTTSTSSTTFLRSKCATWPRSSSTTNERQTDHCQLQ